MKITNDESLKSTGPLQGARLKRDDVRKMVQDYRNENETEQKLFYSHFRLAEILDLFADNKVLPQDIIDSLRKESTQDFIKDFGFKIYLGKYGNTAPEPIEPKFKGHITTIICNTDIMEGLNFADKINTNETGMAARIGQTTIEQDPYLDQANIFPPYYADGEPKCDYDVYYECP